MTPDGADQIYQRIGGALVSVAPPGWTEIQAVYLEASTTSQFQSSAVLPDGEKVWLRGVPHDVDYAFEELRKLLYQEGKGAWYTAHATVTSEGRISFDFDYDNEPAWATPVVPQTYVEDLALFPRDPDQQPQWLREQVQLSAG